MDNQKLITRGLIGAGIVVLAYQLYKWGTRPKDTTITQPQDGKKASADGIDYEDLGDVGDIYAVNDDNFYAVDGEYYSADGDFMSDSGDFYDADGDFISAEGDYLMADGYLISADGEVYENVDGEDMMSLASGQRKISPNKVRKRGRKVAMQVRLRNFKRKLKHLLNVRLRLQKRKVKVSPKVISRLNIKIGTVAGEVKRLEQALKNPALQ